jgi:hypothetical protein
MKEISEATKKLIARYEAWSRSLKPAKEANTIHVDEVASKVAAFYEKLRGIIDWKEEHLLKRGAIERILKRRVYSKADLLSGSFEVENLAEPMVLDLIRSGHFPNDKIEEEKIAEVQRTIEKYTHIINNSPAQKKKSKIRLYNWLFSIAACEIEEILTSASKERALIDYMFSQMKDKIRINEGLIVKNGIPEEEKNIQTYIAVQRALFNLDSPVISYHLLKYYYPTWKNQSPKETEEITKNIYSVWDRLEKDLAHPLGDKFYQICEKYDTPYLILGDVIEEFPLDAEEKINDPEILEEKATEKYKNRLKTLKSRLGRAAFYSTLSIFLTNIVSLLAIEIPFSKYVMGNFSLFAIGVDIFVPTLLMALLVVSIKPPKRKNLQQVIVEIMKIAYKTEIEDIYEVKAYRKGGTVIRSIINFIYLLSSAAFLTLIIWGLYQVNFPPLSHVIFIIFLSLIAFAGAKIRQRSKELQIIEEKETFFHFIFDPFAVPVVQLGKWLTVRWKKYNVISAFFNALIDMPFMVFVEFIEQWRYFLKEKKEEIH